MHYFPFCQHCLYTKCNVRICPECGKPSGILGTGQQLALLRSVAKRASRCIYPSAFLTLIPIGIFGLYFIDPEGPPEWPANGIAMAIAMPAIAMTAFALFRNLIPLGSLPRNLIVLLLLLITTSAAASLYWLGVIATYIPNAFGDEDTYGTYKLILGIIGYLLIPTLIAIHEITALSMIKTSFGLNQFYQARSTIGSVICYGAYILCLSCPMTWGLSFALFFIFVMIALPVLAYRTKRSYKRLDTLLTQIIDPS